MHNRILQKSRKPFEVSLWSIDLFRCKSTLLNSHWVLVVMDQFTRRIVGFGIHAGNVDGIALCRMFNTAISSQGAPEYLSSDNDPLFLYHQWQANLRIPGTDEIKTVPYTPLSQYLIIRGQSRLLLACSTSDCSQCLTPAHKTNNYPLTISVIPNFPTHLFC
jgi:hypothetical protein